MRPDRAEQWHAPSRPFDDRANLFLHHFVALFVISYVVKAVYFWVWPESSFAMDRIYYGLSFDRLLIGLSVVLSAFFIIVVVRTHRLCAQILRGTAPSVPTIRVGPLLLFIGSALVALYFYTARDLLSDLLHGNLLSMFIRNMDREMAASGAAALLVLFRNIVRFFVLLLLIDAYAKRKSFQAVLCSIFFVVEIALSAGSRFNLLASVLVFPLAYYYAGRVVLTKRRAILLVYVATCSLPVLAGILLALRVGGAWSIQDVAAGALVTFDSLDHFLNFLANRDLEFPNWAYYEDLLQVLPRAFFADKPELYGMLKLQVSMYPDSIGGGVPGSISYGHFPLSIMTMSYAFYGAFGVLVMALLTGSFIAIIDHCGRSRNPAMIAVFVFHIVYALNFIRQGFLNFVLAQIQVVYLPLVLVSLVVLAGVLIRQFAARFRATGALMNSESRS